MANNNTEFGRRLQEAADQLRANSKLRSLLFELNRTLRKTRDLLLPRLISGQVSVEGLPLPE